MLQPNEDVALLTKYLLCEEEHKEVVFVLAAAAIVLVLIVLVLVRAQQIAVVVRRAMMLSIIEQDRIFSLSTSSLLERVFDCEEEGRRRQRRDKQTKHLRKKEKNSKNKKKRDFELRISQKFSSLLSGIKTHLSKHVVIKHHHHHHRQLLITYISTCTYIFCRRRERERERKRNDNSNNGFGGNFQSNTSNKERMPPRKKKKNDKDDGKTDAQRAAVLETDEEILRERQVSTKIYQSALSSRIVSSALPSTAEVIQTRKNQLFKSDAKDIAKKANTRKSRHMVVFPGQFAQISFMNNNASGGGNGGGDNNNTTSAATNANAVEFGELAIWIRKIQFVTSTSRTASGR